MSAGAFSQPASDVRTPSAAKARRPWRWRLSHVQLGFGLLRIGALRPSTVGCPSPGGGHSVPAPRHMHHVLMDCKCFSSTLRVRMREIRSSTVIVRASTDGRVSVVRDRLRVRKTQEPRKPSPQERRGHTPGAPGRSVEIKDLASQRPKRSGIPRGNRGASSFAADLRSKVSVCEFRGPRFARDFRRPAGGRRRLSQGCPGCSYGRLGPGWDFGGRTARRTGGKRARYRGVGT